MTEADATTAINTDVSITGSNPTAAASRQSSTPAPSSLPSIAGRTAVNTNIEDSSGGSTLPVTREETTPAPKNHDQVSCPFDASSFPVFSTLVISKSVKRRLPIDRTMRALSCHCLCMWPGFLSPQPAVSCVPEDKISSPSVTFEVETTDCVSLSLCFSSQYDWDHPPLKVSSYHHLQVFPLVTIAPLFSLLVMCPFIWAPITRLQRKWLIRLRGRRLMRSNKLQLEIWPW